MSKNSNKPGELDADGNSLGGNRLDGLPKDTVVLLPQSTVDGFMNNLNNQLIEHHRKKKKKPTGTQPQ